MRKQLVDGNRRVREVRRLRGDDLRQSLWIDREQMAEKPVNRKRQDVVLSECRRWEVREVLRHDGSCSGGNRSRQDVAIFQGVRQLFVKMLMVGDQCVGECCPENLDKVTWCRSSRCAALTRFR